MRYDTPVYFQRITSTYNRETGNYDEGEPVETLRYADVTGTNIQTSKFVYGDVAQRSLTVRLNTYHNYPFDFIRIGDKRYKVDSQKLLRHKQTFIVSEVG